MDLLGNRNLSWPVMLEPMMCSTDACLDSGEVLHKHVKPEGLESH